MPALAKIFLQDEALDGLDNLQLPLETTPEDLQALLTEHQQTLKGDDEEILYAFYLGDRQITKTLGESIFDQGSTLESVAQIRAIPQEKITVSALSRCSAELPGHEDAVLCCQFSPDSRLVASGSGDKTVRIWDCYTATCRAILRGHESWVLALRFSPDGSRLVTADYEGGVIVWNTENWSRMTGGLSRSQSKQKQWVTSVCWDWTGERFFTGSKSGVIRLYNKQGNVVKTVAAHAKSVTSLAVTGRHLVSGSEDCTVQVFDLETLQTVGRLRHGHWVNSVQTNQQYLTRYGVHALARQYNYYRKTLQGLGIDSGSSLLAKPAEEQREILKKILFQQKELIVTASDDHTMQVSELFPEIKTISTLTGHARQINHAVFSPNGLFIASCAFDRTVRIWSAEGKFLNKFQAHASEVYQVVFSADSRLLMSCGKDSTCKVFSIKQQKLLKELPGHQDEVYCVDWSLSGEYGVSGSKDRMLKLWRQ